MRPLSVQRSRSITPTALLLLILMIITPLSTKAFAATTYSTRTVNYTTSTTNIYDTTTASVSQRVDTFALDLIVRMQGGLTLYDQTFNVAFSDPSVQAAILTAQEALTGNGATSFIGPTLLTNSTSLINSVSLTGSPVVTSTDVSAATTMYIGPQTVMVGENQSDTFILLAGHIDYDVLVTSLIHQTITTTTTDTFLTSQVYELVGVPAPVPVPAPILLLGSGLLGLVGFRKKFKK